MKLKVLKQVQMWYLDESDHPPILQETSHGWAIRNGFGSSFVLTTRGSWEYETPPSKRLDDFDSFLALYRFKTAEEAIDAYLNFKESMR